MLKTWLNNCHYIEFQTTEDCLLFWAHHSDFYTFNALHQYVTHHEAMPEDYSRLRAECNLDRLDKLLRLTRVKRSGGGDMPLSHVPRKELKTDFH